MNNTQLLVSKVEMSQSNIRLDRVSALLFPQYSRTKIKNFIINCQVKVNNQYIINPKKKMKGGEIIEITINEKNYNIKFKKTDLNIIYEDQDLFIINKPSGLVVHPGCKNKNHTLLNIILSHYPDLKYLKRSGIVHRLDKNTTGLMIIAKTYVAQNLLCKALKKRKIKREYRAIVHGNIIYHGTINAPIARDKYFKTRMKISIDGKLATTHYQVIKNFAQYTYIKLYLETGRTHQIRVHMAHIQHPIVGDTKYIDQKKIHYYNPLLNINRHALHARKITFIHPIKNIFMQLKINIPEDMRILIKNLIKLNKK
ncbi:MAG: RluA family pseudouridine synthase [Wigglesworthia glossinidia]|nr:RluA family pseudouridine synthase [Wigglesworthia glossinidia]